MKSPYQYILFEGLLDHFLGGFKNLDITFVCFLYDVIGFPALIYTSTVSILLKNTQIFAHHCLQIISFYTQSKNQEKSPKSPQISVKYTKY